MNAAMRYVLVVLLLAGCSKRWTHADYSPDLFQKDNAACDTYALDMSKRGSQRREREIYATCMQGRGWTKTITPAT